MSSVNSQFFAVELIFSNCVSTVCRTIGESSFHLGSQLALSTRDWNADFRPSRVVDSAELSKLRALRAHVDQLALIFPPPTYTPRRINLLVYVRVGKNSLNLANLNFCDGPASSIPNV
jgi:hypothetical protein